MKLTVRKHASVRKKKSNLSSLVLASPLGSQGQGGEEGLQTGLIVCGQRSGMQLSVRNSPSRTRNCDHFHRTILSARVLGSPGAPRHADGMGPERSLTVNATMPRPSERDRKASRRFPRGTRSNAFRRSVKQGNTGGATARCP